MKNLTFNSNLTHIVTNQTFSLTRKLTRQWDFWDYSLLICLIFGTIGNSFSIVVMSTKKLRKTNASLFVCYFE